MNEIAIKTNLGTIDSNLIDIEKSVKEELEMYQNYVVTEDTFKDSKDLLADIRKRKKALDDERKDIKTKWNEPYVEFENKAKAVISLYDEVISKIDNQIKDFEKMQKQAKRERISAIYDECVGELRDYAPLDYIYDSKWENKSVSEKSISEDIEKSLAGIQMAVDTIKMNDKYADKGLEEYKKSHNLQSAMQKMKDFEEMEKAVKEQALITTSSIIPLNGLVATTDSVSFVDESITFIIKAIDAFQADTIEEVLKNNGFKYERRN